MNLPAGVSDILPLTPAQQGMLFHVVESSRARGHYVAVLSCTLTGPLDPQRLNAAMTDAVEARDAYRAGFVWQGVKEPVQIINESVTLPWTELDWQDQADNRDRLDDLIRSEQSRQFDLVRAPLMAVTLIKLAPDRHQLVWTIHHLISDGWSTSAVLRDVFRRYSGKSGSGGQAADYKSYLVWLRKQAPPIDEAFWTDHFARIEGPCRLPPADASPLNDTDDGHVERELGAPLLEQINDLARRLKITTNTVLTVGWALVLRHLVQQDDVIFGQVFAGRPAQIPGIGEAAGAFINTLPLRIRVDPETSAEELLRAVAETQTRVARQEFAPLAQVQTCAGLGKGQPLFDTVFANEGTAETDMDFGEIKLSGLETRQSSNYAMTLLATPSGPFKTELYFDPRRCDAAAARGSLQRYERLLKAMVAMPSSPVRHLAWHDVTPVQVPESRSSPHVLDRFLAAADQNPEAPAVSDMNGTISYGILADRARQVAATLRSRGVGPGDIVPVALERGIDTVAGFLGVMMAGAAYVPIDTSYPEQRIAQIFEQVRPGWIVTSGKVAADLPIAGAEPVLMEELSGGSHDNAFAVGDLAYVIFTSGSQGRPKGVEISHDALAHSTAVRDQVYAETPQSFLLMSPFAFDSSVVGLYWTLATGGHLVIAPTQIEQEPRKLGDLVERHGTTHILCLPSLAQLLLKAVAPRQLESLRTLICAGEILPAQLVEACGRVLPSCRLFNEYGPTETTVWCTVHEAAGQAPDGPVPIGKALPGTWVGICDRDGVPVPRGQVGEITVAGPTLAQGYLSDPETTAASFSPLGPDGPLVYRTGDLGRQRDDGIIDFLGRRDQQLKIRGHRIELTEIEAVAGHAASGSDVAAISHGAPGRLSVTLFVEHAADNGLEAIIRSRIAAELPAPYHPARYAFRDRFPRLPNGKVDRGALKEIAETDGSTDARQPPKNDLEQQVAELFEELLDIRSVPRDGHFFELGGDSLLTLAAQVKGRERGLIFEPIDILDNPTVASLAAHILSQAGKPQPHRKQNRFRQANPDGTGLPVFILHGTMGLFHQVARGLGEDHPVGLSYSHFIFGGGRLSHRISVSDLADQAINHMRRLHPDGPYVICAYSAACAIVLEMTRKLGPDAFEQIFMIDPPYLVVGRDKSRLRGWKAMRRQWLNRTKLSIRVVRHTMKLACYSAGMALFRENEWLRRRAIRSVYAICLSRYRIPTYSGPVQIFLTDENPSMEAGDVMDTHLDNKQIFELNTLHVDAISSPEGITSVSSRIIAFVQGQKSS